MMTSSLSIVLHAPDAEGLQRARMNAVNALRAEPQTQVPWPQPSIPRTNKPMR